MWLTDLVCDLADIETSLVEDGEDASVLSLDQVTDDLVVEIVHLQTQGQSHFRNKTKPVCRDKCPNCGLFNICILWISLTHWIINCSIVVIKHIYIYTWGTYMFSTLGYLHTIPRVLKHPHPWSTYTPHPWSTYTPTLEYSHAPTGCPLSCTHPAPAWARAQWRAAVASHCSSWCRTAQSCNITVSVTRGQHKCTLTHRGQTQSVP